MKEAINLKQVAMRLNKTWLEIEKISLSLIYWPIFRIFKLSVLSLNFSDFILTALRSPAADASAMFYTQN